MPGRLTDVFVGKLWMIDRDRFLAAAVRAHDPQVKILVFSESVESDLIILFAPGQMTAVFGDDGYTGGAVLGMDQNGGRVIFGGTARGG